MARSKPFGAGRARAVSLKVARSDVFSLSLSLGLSVGGVREARLACVPAYSCTTGTVLTTGAVWRALLVSSRPVHEGGSYARPDSQ